MACSDHLDLTSYGDHGRIVKINLVETWQVVGGVSAGDDDGGRQVLEVGFIATYSRRLGIVNLLWYTPQRLNEKPEFYDS